MSYNASIPVATTSPATFPVLCQTNWARLQTLVGTDHQFNLAPDAASDGYHNLVHMRIPSSIPVVGIASIGQLFTNTVSGNNQLFFLSSNSRSYQITPGIVAAVNFQGLGANGPQTINSQINVSSVVKNSTGDYTINFTTALNTDYPVVSVIGARDTSDAPCKPMLRGTGTATNTLSSTLVRVQFSGGTNSLDDVRIGCVIVYSML